MSELAVRAGMNDHLVLGDLLTPRPGPRLASRPLVSQLVADAHVALARPVLATLARDAGLPYLVDPDTVLLQSEVSTEDRWVRLPYGVAEALTPDQVRGDELIESVVEFQLDRGATVIIPPYFYASSPQDPWFELSLQMIESTARFLDDNSVRLPVLPVFAAQLQSFGASAATPFGIDRFTTTANIVDASTVALCLSPTGAGDDGYGKLMRLFTLAIRAKSRVPRVIAWRQGVYGLALVAAGLDGYECGIGTAEQTNISRRQSSRKPQDEAQGSSGGGGTGIFIETIGRSVPRRVGQVLLGDVKMRPKVMCDDESCCTSVANTLDQARHHAIRTRVRMLRQLDEQPHRRWRLNHVARQATAAVTLAAQANKILDAEGEKQRIKAGNLHALAQVLNHLGEDDLGTRTA